MSLLGSVLVVILAIAAFAFVRGMDRSLAGSGSPDNVILLGAGSEESIERSEISPSVAGQVKASVYGIRSEAGQSYVSPEVHAALGVAFEAETEPNAQAVFRGVTSAAYLVHPQVRLVEGRAPNTGADEVIVGQLTATRLASPTIDWRSDKRCGSETERWPSSDGSRPPTRSWMPRSGSR